MSELIGKSLGPYRIVKMLGRGGMGAVYQGLDEADHSVAVKTMLRSLGEDAEMVHRFEREARLAAEIHHPYIARVLGSGEQDEVRYIVMEFVEGKPLSALIREKGRALGRDAYDYVRQAAIGLQAAQQHGVIHRDIKPENLMLNTQGLIKIVDFGLAKSDTGESFKTATGAVMGTPHYMSPEQAIGRGVDHRSDIYSLGATFYHLLTGHTPFEGDTSFAVIQKHISDEPRAVTFWNREVPESVAQIVHRMLKKRPDERYQTYGHLIQTLDDVIEGRNAPSMTMEVVDEIEARTLIQSGGHDRKRLMMIGAATALASVIALGVIFAKMSKPAEPEAASGPDAEAPIQGASGGLKKFKTETVPMLHDIRDAIREQDQDARQFESRREQMNK